MEGITMKKGNRKKVRRQGKSKSKRFSARASLIAIGQFARQLKLFDVIKQKVVIVQKTVKYTPMEKLTDAFISILAGAKGLVEINKLIRPDKMLSLAFGRTSCAEQSTISETFNAVTQENVNGMHDSLRQIYQRHSHGYRHDYEQKFQILDVDLSGMPCGKKAELASKGYFANQKNKRGRQIGRVIATRYGEVVTSALYPGQNQLNKALQPLVLAAEGVLSLDEEKRQKILIRTDAGGGSDADINFVLNRGYHILTKAYSAKRAEKVCQSVKTWYADPKVLGREVGWVTEPHPYVKPTSQIGVRSKRKNGTYSYHLLVTSLDAEHLAALFYLPKIYHHLPFPILWLAIESYDLRGGGIETEFKADKQGLGLTSRNKKKFEAQQMLVLLTDLAHNLIVWVNDALAQKRKRFFQLGIFRMVRDVFTISGKVIQDAKGNIIELILNESDPFAYDFQQGIQPFLNGITVNLGKI